MRNHVMKTLACAALTATALLTGCGSTNQATSSTNPTAQSGPVYGVVESVQQAPAGNSGPGLGAVAGGVLGGVLGNQVGGGRGNTAATAAGVIGGAVVGHQVEQQRNRSTAAAWQIGVRLDNGGYQTVVQDNPGDIAVGNRVRVEAGRAYRY